MWGRLTQWIRRSAAELDRRILELINEYVVTDDQRLDQPAHGGIIVLHQLAE